MLMGDCLSRCYADTTHLQAADDDRSQPRAASHVLITACAPHPPPHPPAPAASRLHRAALAPELRLNIGDASVTAVTPSVVVSPPNVAPALPPYPTQLLTTHQANIEQNK